MTIIKKLRDNYCQGGAVRCWRECTSVQPFWKTVQRYSSTRNKARCDGTCLEPGTSEVKVIASQVRDQPEVQSETCLKKLKLGLLCNVALLLLESVSKAN
jgi:hypothetical protein